MVCIQTYNFNFVVMKYLLILVLSIFGESLLYSQTVESSLEYLKDREKLNLQYYNENQEYGFSHFFPEETRHLPVVVKITFFRNNPISSSNVLIECEHTPVYWGEVGFRRVYGRACVDNDRCYITVLRAGNTYVHFDVFDFIDQQKGIPVSEFAKYLRNSSSNFSFGAEVSFKSILKLNASKKNDSNHEDIKIIKKDFSIKAMLIADYSDGFPQPKNGFSSLSTK